MIRIQVGDSGPRVVLVQIALSTRPPQARLRVDGRFGPVTQNAVKALQHSLTRAQTGVVEGPEWQAMMSTMPFSTFDHADLDDAVVAVAQGNLAQNLQQGHQYGLVAASELARAGQPASSLGVGSSNAVGILVNRIVGAGAARKIGLLRIFGHGGSGLQMVAAGRGLGRAGGAAEHQAALTPTVTRRMRNELSRAAQAFAPYGSAELHGCNVGSGSVGPVLLRDLAEEWRVPVTAGVGTQLTGQGRTFRFEGATITAYPGHGSLHAWAERAAAACAYSSA
jgi:peptidoglycan hydrolase-like protein with peptidoglycan-binding domain